MSDRPEFPTSPPLGPPPSPVPPGSQPPASFWPVDGGRNGAEAPRQRPPTWLIVAAVVAVAALITAAFAVFFDDDRESNGGGLEAVPDRSTTTTTEPEDDESTTTTSEPAPAGPGEFDAVIADIRAFVEQERGLPFLSDVTVELTDDEAFEARLLEDFEEDVADLRIAGDVFQALGLIEADVDVVEAVRTLIGGGVIGFYDPETNELVVRGTSTSPYVRQTIAHELTHALQDQHFELDRPALDDAEDETGFGFLALVEGDAERVASAYEDTFTPEEAAEAAAEELDAASRIDFASIPFVLIEQISLPYALGPDLIDEILDARGQAGLDGAFTAPPTTSEHLFDPATFIEGDPPNPVAEPPADGEVIDRGVLGLLGLTELAGETPLFGTAALPDDVVGWGGDRYVAWHDGDRTCVRVALVGETEQDTDEYEDLLADIAADPPGGVEASVVPGAGPLDPVTYTSCG